MWFITHNVICNKSDANRNAEHSYLDSIPRERKEAVINQAVIYERGKLNNGTWMGNSDQ